MESIEPIPQALTTDEGAARHPEGTVILGQIGSGHAPRRAPAHVTPLSPDAYAVQFTRSREADERFRYLQDLLGHNVSRSDIAEVYDRVEFDHVREFARGGESTVEGLRLRCRGHNQYTAARTFGAGFMRGRREEAAAARSAARETATPRKAERERQVDESVLLPHELEVLPWLRQLGCSADDSRIAATRCRNMADAPLEERVKRALTWFGDRICRKVTPVASDAPSAVAAPLAS